jgi:hypothetical protein
MRGGGAGWPAWWSGGRAGVAALAVLAAASGAATPPAWAWEGRIGGDVRVYAFGLTDADVEGRRDVELGLLRLKGEVRPTGETLLEAHGVLGVGSPRIAGTTTIATGTTRRLLTLQDVLVDETDVQVAAELDRLSVAWQRSAFRLVAGRQAVTWGVSAFWPVLDLFAPFPPERIDREYKPGVDALRLTVPLGPLSELDVVAAGQGTSLERDGSAAALLRVHAGAADVGAMAGWFHRDIVGGVFVTADVRGTGVRAEVAYTDSGDPADAELDRSRFWRASAGFDRQLTPTLSVSVEGAWNGFGTSDVGGYARVAATDRVRRGEVASLGQWYVGASAGWQAHPLLMVTATVLANVGDGSVLLLSQAEWSLGDNVAFTLGAIIGLGPGPAADGRLRSEYGAAADAVYAALRAYF